ncbi:hypothetical protein CTI12_AA532140 [Artemisia annua]|uniref:Uncharacterized protein n=1 Tax=Artemisia annua TaxID=35608 RepID=A0A2U1L4C2_ARTAN|nr:hypothetical protein CTI12_AA532140 [Artemisia annua]
MWNSKNSPEKFHYYDTRQTDRKIVVPLVHRTPSNAHGSLYHLEVVFRHVGYPDSGVGELDLKANHTVAGYTTQTKRSPELKTKMIPAVASKSDLQVQQEGFMFISE